MVRRPHRQRREDLLHRAPLGTLLGGANVRWQLGEDALAKHDQRGDRLKGTQPEVISAV